MVTAEANSLDGFGTSKAKRQQMKNRP